MASISEYMVDFLATISGGQDLALYYGLNSLYSIPGPLILALPVTFLLCTRFGNARMYANKSRLRASLCLVCRIFKAVSVPFYRALQAPRVFDLVIEVLLLKKET